MTEQSGAGRTGGARAGAGRRAVVVALMVGGGGVMASCNLIVGVGDYSVGGNGPPDGTANGADVGGDDVGFDQTADLGPSQARGQDSPSGGRQVDVIDARPDAIADASAGEADTSASADADADRLAADGGDAGRDADGGASEAEAGVVACGQGLPTGTAFQNLVSACVLATGCDPFDFPVSLSDCITRDVLHAVPGFNCFASITSCNLGTNTFYGCGGTRFADPECNMTNVSSCAGNVALDCSAAVPFPGVATNCTVVGGTCQTYTDTASHSRADCVVTPSCTLTDAGDQCSGSFLYSCTPTAGGGSIGVGFNCATLPGTCTQTASGDTCLFNGTGTCINTGTGSCSGTTLEGCSSTGQLFSYDCTQAGGACADDGAGSVGCVSRGCSLTSACTEACNGTLLTACVGGTPYTIDCANFGDNGGFTQCTTTTSGSARCAP
jgi:hypothetical protein